MKIIKVKEWKERQFIHLEPDDYKNRVERVIDKKIFIQCDPSLVEKILTDSDFHNLNKPIHLDIYISEFCSDLINVGITYSWTIHDWTKDTTLYYWEKELYTPINDIEAATEKVEKEIYENIKENLAFINNWKGEKIEELGKNKQI